MVSDIGDGIYIRGWIYAGASTGTMVGAFIMLQKKLIGLHIYTIAQVIYILTILMASFSYGELGGLTSFVTMIFLLPSILFLIFYWSMAREDLG